MTIIREKVNEPAAGCQCFVFVNSLSSQIEMRNRERLFLTEDSSEADQLRDFFFLPRKEVAGDDGE